SFSVSEELLKRMKKYPEIKWETIVRTAVKNYLEKLENADNNKEIESMIKLSELSLKDFLENEPDLYSDDDLKRYR
ncbi:MAG: hypothetical protein KAX33_12485, partial [Candidatus Lokiarchaeota archaeon]|nr:hypothetical protein [Candidatus Lokiarchaeota archaeon]